MQGTWLSPEGNLPNSYPLDTGRQGRWFNARINLVRTGPLSKYIEETGELNVNYTLDKPVIQPRYDYNPNIIDIALNKQVEVNSSKINLPSCKPLDVRIEKQPEITIKINQPKITIEKTLEVKIKFDKNRFG